jgi:hypothetical protein
MYPKCFRDTIYIGCRIPWMGYQSIITNVAGVWVGTLLCMWEVHDQILSQTLAVLTETFFGFP